VHREHCTQCLDQHRNGYPALGVEGDGVNDGAGTMVGTAATVSECRVCL